MRFYADFQPPGQDTPTIYAGHFTIDGNLLWDVNENDVPTYVLSKIGTYHESQNAYGVSPELFGMRVPLAICIGITIQE